MPRTRPAHRRAITIAGITALAPLAAMATAILPAHATTDQPPECVTITVRAYTTTGALARTRLEFCGNSGGADSPLHDWAAGKAGTLSGAPAIGHGCGGNADPCVILGP